MRKIHLDQLRIGKHLCNLESDEIIKKALLAEKRCLIKAYMISAFALQSRDNGSASDPYLILECNGKTFSERDNYQLDNSEPEFNKCFQFEGTFPGTSPLVIHVMDYDMVFGDDLIGTSTLDLEDRYFSIEWNGL
jgi:Ca2+-dependent lipid-binding protein